MTPLQQHLSFYNKEEEISFNEAEHKYFDKLNTEDIYTSVTQFLGQYEPGYDREFWAMFTALKEKDLRVKPDPEKRTIAINGQINKISSLLKDKLYKCWYDEIDARWKGLNEEACIRGTNTHNYLEDTINQSKGMVSGYANNHLIKPKSGTLKNLESISDLDNTDLAERFPYIYNRLKGYIERDCIIFAEKRVRLDLVKLAGMIDVPIIKRHNKNFIIVDWKTNKDELKSKPGYYKKIKVGGKWIKSDTFVETDATFKYPINHLPYAKLYIYALQLSLYAYILECWGYTLVEKGLEIIHIRDGFEPKLIRIPYLINEVEALIKHRLEEMGMPFFDVTQYQNNFR